MRTDQSQRRARAHHTDDWLITYADTITLLLCLFVIIVTIRTGENARTHDAVKPVQASTSEDFFGGHPPFPMPARATRDIVPDETVATTEPDPQPPSRLTTPARMTDPVERPPEPFDAALFASLPDPVAPPTAFASVPAIMDRLRSQASTPDPKSLDRVTTLQVSSATFFSSGSATLSGAGKTILRDVATTLKVPAFAGFHISIEGHTDDTPISTAQFQSNWELSTARAAAVVRFFLEQGLPPERLTAAGYADTFPIAPNRNADGTVIPENQGQNRRVVIRLERLEKADRP